MSQPDIIYALAGKERMRITARETFIIWCDDWPVGKIERKFGFFLAGSNTSIDEIEKFAMIT